LGSSSVGKVHIHHAGVYCHDSALPWKNRAENPGQAKLKRTKDDSTKDLPLIPVYSIDSFARERGWFTERKRISILKVDVEGLEAMVFEGATELISFGLVDNIFMEIAVRKPVQKRRNQPMLDLFIKSGYHLYRHGESKRPTTLSATVFD
jgi:FkbM family methyltransferase